MKDDFIMLDDSGYNRFEEEVLREMLGDEGYEEMMAQIKAEQEEERHMSRRQLRKKRAARRSGFDCPAIGTPVPKDSELVQNENGTFTLKKRGEK